MRKNSILPLSMNLQHFAEPANPGDPISPVSADPAAGSQEPASSSPAASSAVGSSAASVEPASSAAATPGLKYTDDDLDRILASKKARWQQELVDQQSEAKKLENMTAEERLQFELDKTKKEKEALETQQAVSEMKTTTRGMFEKAGLPIDENIVSMVTTTDAESTQANFKQAEAWGAAIKKAVETEFLTGDNQRVPGSKAEVAGALGAQVATQVNPAAKDNPYIAKSSLS